MPRATLIHNTTAGDGRPTGGELRDLMARHGYGCSYATTDDDLDAVLRDPGDLVVAAGGDGTVGEVAARLVGRDVPLAILPVGTANNLAATLGVTGPVHGIVDGWRRCRRRPVRVGIAKGPWGRQPLVESFGLGLFPHAVPIISTLSKARGQPLGREERIRQHRAILRRLLDRFTPRSVDLRLDGRYVGGDYLLVEALNGAMMGPRLHLASGADPGDGRFEVILAGESDRKQLAQWLDADPEVPLGLPLRTARLLELVWDGDPLHIDGETWAGPSAPFRPSHGVTVAGPAAVRVTLEPGFVSVLAPWP